MPRIVDSGRGLIVCTIQAHRLGRIVMPTFVYTHTYDNSNMEVYLIQFIETV